jgi:FG-GAP-like repeat
VVYEIVKTALGYNPTPNIVVNFSGSANVGLGANLVADANGDLFATTLIGGANNKGAVLEITDSGFSVIPVLTAGANTSYVAGATPVALNPGLSIVGSNLKGATVSIGAGLLPGDALTVGSPQGGITSSYNAGTGVLTLSGSASRAAYQAELDSVTFASAGALNPGSRTISWSVTDGSNPPALATSSVAVFVSNPDLDIRLQSTSGQGALWQASGSTTPTLSAAALLGANAGASWFAEGSGGFFSGGASDASDILLQNTNGSVAVWQMQGATFLLGNVVANPGLSWHVEGTGDFNGDSKTDIAMQNSNGNVAVWEMSGGQISQAGEVANPGSNWQVEATGDFNQDGKSDLVLQNTNGNVAIWNMNGDQILPGGASVVANPGPSWHVEGTGDFNGDGKTDIVLQNNNGSVSIWNMNGDQLGQGIAVANPGPNWHVASTGDFNHDGTTDITLQNNNGAVAVWDINNDQIIHSAVLANPGPTWSVTGNGRHSSIS